MFNLILNFRLLGQFRNSKINFYFFEHSKAAFKIAQTLKTFSNHPMIRDLKNSRFEKDIERVDETVSSATRCWNEKWPNFNESWPKVVTEVFFTFKSEKIKCSNYLQRPSPLQQSLHIVGMIMVNILNYFVT